MDRFYRKSVCTFAGIAVAAFAMAGCRSSRPISFLENPSPDSSSSFTAPSTSANLLDYPDVERRLESRNYSMPPLTSADHLPPQAEMSLDQAIEIALTNSKILRSLNAQVLSNPAATTGVFDPAIQSSDPLFGVEAALSQFDANLSASLNHANNDDVFNNSILGGGATEVVQDLTVADFALRKTAATGTSYLLRSNFAYDNNNNVSSTFPSSYTGFWEAQVRQPLLQGNGLAFNRIAGPNASPGFRNTSGVLLSRIDNDISIAQFELGVRQFVDEIITAYWNLQFAYRNYESTKLARDTTLKTWNSVKSRYDNNLSGGEADKEAQAREQYYQFQQEVITALNGDTRSGRTGILQAEADLRRLIGYPQADGTLILPSDQPQRTKVIYDWDMLLNQSIDQRVEIRSQLWRVKRTELELLASKNFLLPRLDAVATFRNNGFGDDLQGGGFRFSSVFSDMSTGDHNEWEMGLQVNIPLGYRQAAAGVRNSQLKLQRERAILDEQEKQIIYQLGNAFRQSEQNSMTVKLAYNRMLAAQDTVDARQAGYEADTIPLDLLLEAQRRFSEAQTAFFQAQVNLQLAHESIERESGNLLVSHNIQLGSMTEQVAACDNGNRNSRRISQSLNYALRR